MTEKGKVLALGDITVPKICTSILQKGPKFATETRLSPVYKVLHSRDVSARVPEDLRPRCVIECVEVVKRTHGKEPPTPPPGYCLHHLGHDGSRLYACGTVTLESTSGYARSSIKTSAAL
ncbi:hypothetical protein HPB52_010725 [Rhipicephalus sanguineus]|uniref:Uncharacterized protein n=1 Tax=Rhipicephalus sanguineus TaxID=34632 RepID=A0A9D4PZ84_RHISA|nr:hypothetical protein HPB52_010725 [Rhipicephalus sanguineus]